MKLKQLSAPRGSRRANKRRGRGEGSGQGTTAGRGHKGQKSRAGGPKNPWFEGGQNPLWRRIPKAGFKNIFRIERAVVNVRDLDRFDTGSVVTRENLVEAGLLKGSDARFKVLGNGELKKALTIKATAFSKKAQELIEKAGGKVEVVK